MSRTVSLITLGVHDKARARAFYEALGWHGVDDAEDEPVFFQAGETVLALCDRDRLAVDSWLVDAGGWGGVTFTYCVPIPDDVDRCTQTAQQAGARLLREPAATFWGGYSSMVIDPDGHPWEIAYNPAWQATGDGAVQPQGLADD